MRYYRPEDGETLPGDDAGLGITRPEWHALIDELLELNDHRALPGVIAIVHERIRHVRSGSMDGADLAWVSWATEHYGEQAKTAALIAAAIDAQGRP